MPALSFDPDTHTYTLRGQVVPSVTQVLGVLNDFSAVPWAVLEAARRRGQAVHEAVELLLQGRLDRASLDPAIVPYVESFEQFALDTGFEPLITELRVAGPNFAGTLDALGKTRRIRRGSGALFDWKTSLALPSSVGPQLAAYQQAYRDTLGELIRSRYCLRLTPGSYKLDRMDEDRYWHIFKSALNLWWYVNGTN